MEINFKAISIFYHLIGRMDAWINLIIWLNYIHHTKHLGSEVSYLSVDYNNKIAKLFHNYPSLKYQIC